MRREIRALWLGYDLPTFFQCRLYTPAREPEIRRERECRRNTRLGCFRIYPWALVSRLVSSRFFSGPRCSSRRVSCFAWLSPLIFDSFFFQSAFPGGSRALGERCTKSPSHSLISRNSRSRISPNALGESVQPTQELRDETRTGWECGRRDECTHHTLPFSSHLMLSPRERESESRANMNSFVLGPSGFSACAVEQCYWNSLTLSQLSVEKSNFISSFSCTKLYRILSR